MTPIGLLARQCARASRLDTLLADKSYNYLSRLLTCGLSSQHHDLDRSTGRPAGPRRLEPVAERHRPADQRSGGAAGVLRLPSRTLGPPAQLESDRERVGYSAASDRADQRGALGHDRQADGAQAGDGGVENLAPAEGRKQVTQGRGRRHLPRRDRGRREPRSPRLLTGSVT